jgi:hypothetical protein
MVEVVVDIPVTAVGYPLWVPAVSVWAPGPLRRTLRRMENDTKDHFRLHHEALDRTNKAIDDLLAAIKEDAPKAKGALR